MPDTQVPRIRPLASGSDLVGEDRARQAGAQQEPGLEKVSGMSPDVTGLRPKMGTRSAQFGNRECRLRVIDLMPWFLLVRWTSNNVPT